MSGKTVRVQHLSDLATDREIHEFFSFSGEIELIDLHSDVSGSKTAFVTFKTPDALEIALRLSGAMIVDKPVIISRAENYVPTKSNPPIVRSPERGSSAHEETPKRVYANKAQEVVAGVIAKGSLIGHEAMSKAKALDEKHRLREKLTIGISAVNEKVKSVDQRLDVSNKTMAAIFAAEKKINTTGAAVKSSRYVSAGSSWLNGAFSKMTRAGQVAGSKTREKFNLAVSNLTAKDSSIVV